MSAAVGIGAMGDCTTNNGVRNFRRAWGFDAFPAQYQRPFSKCGPIVRDPADSPLRLYHGASYYKDFWGKWRRYDSPLTGSGTWGRNLGWDFVGDHRWPAATCADLNPGSCQSKTYPVAGTDTHAIFPYYARPPGKKTGPTYWESTVFPEMDAFFRSAKPDDEV